VERTSKVALSRHRKERPGLTLLEVIIALSIFLFSLVALGRLITFASEEAMDIDGREAQLCQSKLSEIVSGVTGLTSAEGDFDEAPDWHWAIECEQSGYTNLWNVKVTVSRNRSDGSRAEAILTQMVYDPAQRGSTLDPDPTSQTTDDSTNTSGSSGSQSGSSSPSGAASSGGTGQPATGAGAGAGTMKPATGAGAGAAKPATGGTPAKGGAAPATTPAKGG
jgi:hypothetical protein